MMKRILAIGFMVTVMAAFNLRRADALDWTAINPDLEGATSVTDLKPCIKCHEDYMKPFENTRHSRFFKHAGYGRGVVCEKCHGPMSKHLEEAPTLEETGKMATVASFDWMTVKQKNQVCLQCHDGGKRAFWAGSIHESKGFSCSGCHYVMEKKSDQGLLINEDSQDICLKCHKQIRADMNKQSHHPLREGKIKCQDCHNPHGTITEKLLAANSVNELCYQCHAEKRGPFLWEHAPVTENCINCHTAHGSSHDKLLVAKRPYLCQQCHSNSRHPGTIYALREDQAGQSVYQASSNRLFYRSCSNCHSQVHGSNHPSGKSLAR